MAYQNVSTPRFYVDHLQYIRAIGKGHPYTAEDIFNLNPSSFLANKPLNNATNYWDFGFFPQDDDESGDSQDEALLIPNVNYGKLNYLAILGHNLGTGMTEHLNIGFRNNVEYTTDSDEQLSDRNLVEVVNFEVTDLPMVSLNGFSIATFDDYNFNGINLHFDTKNTIEENKIGSMSLGSYYDMPVAPDLSLSLEHDYSGIKKTTSMSGASFSNANWIKPPKWGDKEAWQLGDFPRPYSGRRIWDLSFSYISDSNLEPRNYTGTKVSDDGLTYVPSDVNWFENVLHYTMGGHLPFIFQPDKDATYTWADETPPYIDKIPEFAICRFDMNSFKREQVAPDVYNIKIKVKETW